MSEAHLPSWFSEVIDWRRRLHTVPELGYELPQTQKFVSELLASFGCDSVSTAHVPGSVVATIRGRKQSSEATRTLGLRSDMDALPIAEQSELRYRSQHPNCMHACGHDGHIAALLGAARWLASTRDFAGTVVMLFQPAEENGAGGQAMVAAGVLDTYGVEEVYAIHNWPSLPTGQAALRCGPIMGSVHRISGRFIGSGGHAAAPNRLQDAILATSSFVTTAHAALSREKDALDPAVFSITRLTGGTNDNVMPGEVEIEGTLRTLSPLLADAWPRRIVGIAEHVAAAHGCTARVSVSPEYPVTINAPECVKHAAQAARAVLGNASVQLDYPPTLLSEDFAFLLRARPGAIVFFGSGPSADLHAPQYDFNDEVLPHAVRFWRELVKSASERPRGGLPQCA